MLLRGTSCTSHVGLVCGKDIALYHIKKGCISSGMHEGTDLGAGPTKIWSSSDFTFGDLLQSLALRSESVGTNACCSMLLASFSVLLLCNDQTGVT
jgi:hypothetical protein